jgi:hypothetical protein
MVVSKVHSGQKHNHTGENRMIRPRSGIEEMRRVIRITHYGEGKGYTMSMELPSRERFGTCQVNWLDKGSDNKCLVGPVENMNPIITIMEMVTGQEFRKISTRDGITEWKRVDILAEPKQS